ncbi:hypothetical protein P153DRAFT_91043 [Dothidotthia symphoricarpi CBS 119687]|uniref:Uncharacterized protein n=1 Tax=Dothidotthia symphoricarpi CBS 119687 TaxID=1392245 RepID=A0A6A6A1E8_9PLEO|nr:uncharacterized protein P153DRAFT_91043 [Dothidotthia symphoricarpi CBS 119687]KAF2125669.1 hypothetical protein P153DRAFT_91043 [Dothidotthia symphoricarpi CBS 119687]
MMSTRRSMFVHLFSYSVVMVSTVTTYPGWVNQVPESQHVFEEYWSHRWRLKVSQRRKWAVTPRLAQMLVAIGEEDVYTAKTCGTSLGIMFRKSTDCKMLGLVNRLRQVCSSHEALREAE